MVVLAVAVVSFWYGLGISMTCGEVGVACGAVIIVWPSMSPPRGQWEIDVEPTDPWNKWELTPTLLPGWESIFGHRLLLLPLWPFVLLSALVAGWLWRRDRPRPGPGHCQRCGYNLRGNVSGVCPECGEPA